MTKRNYQSELDEIIENIDEKNPPSLLLHSCCGPCSSYVLEYLSEFFRITVFYYNPNIYPSEEYWYRVEEQQKIIDITDAKNSIEMITGEYETERFYALAKGLENLDEGGKRCHRCYELRLREAAKIAKEGGFDYFTTTLSISPHKNSQVLNEIGERVGNEEGVKHLPSDFKKNNGYKRSCEITSKYGLYRQDYCGCVFSKNEKERRDREKEEREKIYAKKSALRKKMKKLSEELDEKYLCTAEDIITEKLFEDERFKNSSSIFIYVGTHPEIDTKKIIEKALSMEKKVAVPLCVDDRKMVPVIINSMDELSEGMYGILEPEFADINDRKTYEKRILSSEDTDLVIVPCCCADSEGNRLGFGKGYYDRFLRKIDNSRVKNNLEKSEKILLIRKRQMVEKVPVDFSDVKIENIITE